MMAKVIAKQGTCWDGRAVEKGVKTWVLKVFFTKPKKLKIPNLRFLRFLKKNLENPDFRLTVSHSRELLPFSLITRYP